MARKRKASEGTPASKNESLPERASPTTSAKRSRPKIDWNAIDDNGGFGGFTVKAVTGKKTTKPVGRPSLKKQRQGDGSPAPKESYKHAPMSSEVRQPNPYPETNLSEVCVKVEPQAEWESTQRYRKFTINSEEFEVGQIVFVKKPDADSDSLDAIPQWFAKVLEVRAPDPSHVFLRVYWAYRPEDFPAGRQPHHGAAELIVSNHMDIIEAVTVESVANVIHWNDNPEDSAWPAKDQLFWRQSYDITKPKGKQFSTLPKFCIDKAPCNPDEPVVQCPSCKAWLHARCLEDAAVHNTVQKFKKEPKPRISAKLSTADLNKTRLTVTIRDSEDTTSHDVAVQCLMCDAMIDGVESTSNDSDSEGINVKSEDDDKKEVADTPNPQTPTAKDVPKSTDEESSPKGEITPEESQPTTVSPGKSKPADPTLSPPAPAETPKTGLRSILTRRFGFS